ncbi:MAG TPA: PQQ-binding-like beta-propeller repeat protein [Bryobacteraceae bacterium]|nr:PQQ-binding-like beta-propeller repeat protein [Bryobacteraceae bacterium]
MMLSLRFTLLAGCFLAVLHGQSDWPVFGHDPGAIRYSPLKQITAGNVSRLRRAWTFHSGKAGSEVTPIVVNGVMYLTQPNGIFALEPETGKLLWKYEAPGAALRGLCYWPGGRGTHARVFAGVRNNLVAIDVTTGKPAPGFGNEGIVDLKQGVADDLPDAELVLPSPPAVYRDIVITGSANGEGAPSAGAYGDIRGWDARTGKLVWTFHTVPRPGEPGNETWPEGGWKNRSGTNTWGFFSVDVERGLVFAPTGCPTSDFYGADRHGNNLYANSVIALDAATGALRWHQQLVHHDLWDYDLAAAPALIEVKRNGKKIPAVAQITKMGTLFIFDRLTGQPLFGIEERPVPPTNIPGEVTSPTQPFPLKPPPLARNSFREEEMYNLTPEHAAFCRDLWRRNGMFVGVPFTPLPLEGNVLIFPSTLGGGNWGGVSFDPSLGYLFANVMNIGQFGHMEKREDPKTGAVTYIRTSEYGPYARFWNRDTRIPCTNPPFGELVAVNVNTGDIAWKVPLGTVESLEAQGVKNTGALNLGGSIATAGGLVFIAATNDSRIRAFESKTGRMLWEHRIDANGHAIPVTYLGKDRKQYVVIMAGGGGGYFGGATSDTLTAFALGAGPSSNEVASSPPRAVPVTEPVSAAPAPRAQGGPVGSPDSAGQAIVDRSCGKQCHSLEVVSSQRLSRTEWKRTVDAMVARGATLTDAEVKLVLDYLSRHFGR